MAQAGNNAVNGLELEVVRKQRQNDIVGMYASRIHKEISDSAEIQ